MPMPLHPTEAQSATVRTQKLSLVAECIDKSADATQRPEARDDGGNQHETMYLAFEAPLASAPDGESDSVEVTLLESDLATEQRPAPTPTDPAELVQIQALELAANRAELARQERQQDELHRAVRLRDGWLEDLRNEVRSLKDERKNLAAQLTDARASLQKMSNTVTQQAAQIAQLEADASERMSVTAFAPDGPRTRRAQPAEALNLENPAKLEPLDDDSAPIVLNRKLMTVGRTRESDICVPSVLVSRDHARMLVSEGNVVMFDVGSINGCFVNDHLVKRQVLRNGDVLRFADRRYRYCA
jgi:hypothetical protein